MFRFVYVWNLKSEYNLEVFCCSSNYIGSLSLSLRLPAKGLHRSVKQIVTATPRASEAYISTEGRAKMIIDTIASTPQDTWGLPSCWALYLPTLFWILDSGFGILEI